MLTERDYIEGAAKGLVLGFIEGLRNIYIDTKKREKDEIGRVRDASKELKRVFSNARLLEFVQGPKGIYGIAYFKKTSDDIERECVELAETLDEAASHISDLRFMLDNLSCREAKRVVASIDDFLNNFFNAVVELAHSVEFRRVAQMSALIREEPNNLRLLEQYEMVDAVFSEAIWSITDVLMNRNSINPFFQDFAEDASLY